MIYKIPEDWYEWMLPYGLGKKGAVADKVVAVLGPEKAYELEEIARAHFLEHEIRLHPGMKVEMELEEEYEELGDAQRRREIIEEGEKILESRIEEFDNVVEDTILKLAIGPERDSRTGMYYTIYGNIVQIGFGNSRRKTFESLMRKIELRFARENQKPVRDIYRTTIIAECPYRVLNKILDQGELELVGGRDYYDPEDRRCWKVDRDYSPMIGTGSKRNGYKSLNCDFRHVNGNAPLTFEVQIRDPGAEKIAHFGSAAHRLYKEKQAETLAAQ